MTTTTTNYGWVKPDVGASDDVWGGYINTDLDGIDTIVKGVSVVANAAYPASNPSGYQTAAQVAAVVIGDNRIINGDMRIDQRNGGASGTANQYTVDRWGYYGAQSGKGAWQGAPSSGLAGFPRCLGFSSTSAYTPAAADVFQFNQPIEADAISDFAWGTPQAQPVTLSFWALTNGVTGTFGGAIGNFAATRSYPFTYSIPTAATWTKITLTIPGDMGGTWVMAGNAGALQVYFSLGCGSTYRGPPNTWASAAYYGAVGQANVVATNGAGFFVTGVKLEIGSVATPFNRQSLAKSMADCQRYYQVGSFKQDTYAAQPTSVFGSYQPFPVTMRVAPTVTPTFTTQTNCSGGGVVIEGAVGLEVYAQLTAAGNVALAGTFTAAAEL